MRFLKKQNLSKFRRTDRTVSYDEFGNVVMNTPRTLRLPKGDTPNRDTTPQNGMIRYNTDIEDIEVYVNGIWRRLRYKEPVEIVQQNLGYGDYVKQMFGPLYPVPYAGQNVLVLIENVIQIHNTNYTLVQTQEGWWLYFDQPPPSKPITVLHNFDR
jgi:hypothetical protein